MESNGKSRSDTNMRRSSCNISTWLRIACISLILISLISQNPVNASASDAIENTDANGDETGLDRSIQSSQHSPSWSEYTRSRDWEEWSYSDGTHVRRIYLAPRYVFNPLNNSWCDWLLLSNGSGQYVATSRIWAHINESSATFFSRDFGSIVGGVCFSCGGMPLSARALLSVEENQTGVFISQSYPSAETIKAEVKITYSFLPGSPLKIGFLIKWLGDSPCRDLQFDWKISLNKADYYQYDSDLAKMASQGEQVVELSTRASTGKSCAIHFYDTQGDGVKAVINNLSRYFQLGIDWTDAENKTVKAALFPSERSLTLTFGNFSLERGEAVSIDPTITTERELEDTFVSEDDVNSPHGAESYTCIMLVKEYDDPSVWRYRTYIKFSLLSLPAGSSISLAKIYLYLYSTSTHSRHVGAHYVSNNGWSEATLTWNLASSLYGYNGTATAVNYSTTTTGWKSWDVTGDARKGFLNNPNKVFSECLKFEDEGGSVPPVPNSPRRFFRSKEASSNHPYLQVTYTLKRYAVLIGSGGDATDNYARYYNDLMFMYDTLVTNYSYSPSEIYVLYADGSVPGTGNCPDHGNAYSHTNVIDYSATKASLQTVFTSIASVSDGTTFIMVFLTGHGDHDPFGNPPDAATHVYFTTWGEDIRDDEFAGANYLGKVTSYNLEFITMGQCYSGGFIDDLQNNKRIIYTAVTFDHESNACDDKDQRGGDYTHEGYYEEFLYQLICALHGRTPNNPYPAAVSDYNGDGFIELSEAFDYAKYWDSQAGDNPQSCDALALGSYTHL